MFTICCLKWYAYGACDMVLPHCHHHWSVQWWGGGGWLNNSCQRWWWLVKVVTGWVVMKVVIEKGNICLLITCLWCGKCLQTSWDLPASNSEGIPLPSVKGKGLCEVRHSIPLPLPSKPLPMYPQGFPNPCSSLTMTDNNGPPPGWTKTMNNNTYRMYLHIGHWSKW